MGLPVWSSYWTFSKHLCFTGAVKSQTAALKQNLTQNFIKTQTNDDDVHKWKWGLSQSRGGGHVSASSHIWQQQSCFRPHPGDHSDHVHQFEFALLFDWQHADEGLVEHSSSGQLADDAEDLRAARFWDVDLLSELDVPVLQSVDRVVGANAHLQDKERGWGEPGQRSPLTHHVENNCWRSAHKVFVLRNFMNSEDSWVLLFCRQSEDFVSQVWHVQTVQTLFQLGDTWHVALEGFTERGWAQVKLRGFTNVSLWSCCNINVWKTTQQSLWQKHRHVVPD